MEKEKEVALDLFEAQLDVSASKTAIENLLPLKDLNIADQGMEKHLKDQKNAFPATNHSSGHFRTINRPNRESSKIAKNRDFR